MAGDWRRTVGVAKPNYTTGALVELIRGVPVIHPIAARVWYIQKQLHIRQTVKGAGRLLGTLP